jgi:hypothetical protein
VAYSYWLVETGQAMRRQPKAIDLPDEFKLAEYKRCASWGLREWAAALTIRSSIRKSWLLVCLEGKNKNVTNHIMHFVQDASIRILSNPLDTNLDVNLFNAKPSYKLPSPIKDQSPADYFAGVYTFNHDRRYLEWVNRAIYIENEDYTYDDDDHNETLAREENKFYETPAWKMHEESADGGFSIDIHSLFISVDLRIPDNELVSEFKKWLAKKRKDIGITPKQRPFNENDFADWHSDRLLQYLDLTFWAMTHNVKFTNEQIGKAIFPEDSASESRVRRTIRINAHKIVSDEYILALNNQNILIRE